MKPNSCVYRATAAVCEFQFGVSITSEVFDSHNEGKGIPLQEVVPIINMALDAYDIEVETVWCHGIQGAFKGKELVRVPSGLAPVPAIVFIDKGHAEPALPGTHISGVMSITLKART